MTAEAGAMRAAWEQEAPAWIAWARAPGQDHFFWRFTRPALLGLLPAPGRLTVDLGSGEGRLSRELRDLGHRVVGIEQSPTLADAARIAAPDIEVHTADAAALPLDDAAADLVVASMVLLNLDDLDGAVREVARVLEPGGRFAFSTVHPLNSFKALGGHDAAGGSYFATYSYAERRERGGHAMTFHDTHRPLHAIFDALEGAGLLTEAVREPRPGVAYLSAHPEVERWRRAPAFLLVRALKP
jgi:SAM-dependent methyltransferase